VALFFRNLDVTPDDPVEQWGVEGVLAAIDLSSYVSGDVVQSTAMFLRLERLSVDCETSQRPHVDTLTRGATALASTRAVGTRCLRYALRT